MSALRGRYPGDVTGLGEWICFLICSGVLIGGYNRISHFICGDLKGLECLPFAIPGPLGVRQFLNGLIRDDDSFLSDPF